MRKNLEIEAALHDDMVMFAVAEGERFVPKLFSDLGVPIQSVNVARPSLDDVFMSFTGSTMRDAEASSSERLRSQVRGFKRGR